MMWRVLPLVALASCQTTWPDTEPEAPVLRRLTQTQYENSVRDLLGDDVFVPPDLEPDLRIHGLVALGSSAVSISPRGVERYEAAAYGLAEQAMEPWRRPRLLSCEPEAVTDDACARSFFETFGRRAWRRPLEETELDALVDVSSRAATTLGDFHAGLEFGIAALFQSPDFLLRVEVGAPADDGTRRYTSWETASRLSFLFWNTTPDESLLNAAASGILDTPAGLDAQAQRLLEHPRAKEGLRAWVSDMLKLNELEDLQKDPATFVSMTDGLGPSAREETLLGFEHIVFNQDTDIRDVLTTRDTFVDRTLATLYEVRAPTREGFGPVSLPEDGPRMGLLGQASILALHAHSSSTSPTLRGRFIRETLLCEILPAPPGDVDTSIPPADVSAPTLRERVQSHLTVPVCASCHRKMDLPGLALENFDGIGQYRELDNGHPVDASGELDGTVFSDAVGLSEALREHEQLVPCLVEQVVRRALGRDVGEGEEESFNALVESFRGKDHRLQPLWLDLVQHPLFLQVGSVSTEVTP